MVDMGDLRLPRQSRRNCRPCGWFKTEALALIKLAWPTAVGYLLEQIVFIVSVAFCGHIDETSSVPLDAAAFAVSVIGITGLSLAIGLATAMDTLAAQAWGAKNYLKVGVYLQRCILIFSLAMAPVYSLWFNIESILNLLHQPPCVVEQATQYIHIFSAALPAVYLYVLLQRYLQAQNIVWPFIFTGLIANLVSALFHYLLIFVAGMGIRGAAISVVLANYTLTGVLLVIIYVRKLHVKTWGGWSRECLKDWYQIVRYGLPGCVMIGVEWWTFEIGIFVTGFLADSETQQGIYAILANYVSIVVMVTVALSVALSIRVGNELGAGNVKAAKRAVLVALIFISVWTLLIVALTLALKDLLPRIFTSDPCLLAVISVPMIVMACSIGSDSIQGILGGVLRGSGKQLLGSIVNIVSFWVIGLPLGTVLTIVAGLGATGYWIGLSTGSSLQAIIYTVIVLSMNWRKESEKAQRMAGKELEHKESSQLAIFHVDSEEEENGNSTRGMNGQVMKGMSNSLSVQESEACYEDDGDQVAGEDDDAVPLLPYINTENLPSCNSSAEAISSEKSSCYDMANGLTPDHHDHLHGVRGSDLDEETQLDDDLLPLISEEEEGESDWGGSQRETDTETDTEPMNTPTNTVTASSLSPIPLRTIILRVATLLAMIVLFTVSVTVSQLYVYQSSTGVCNTTNSTLALNVTTNITSVQPSCVLH